MAWPCGRRGDLLVPGWPVRTLGKYTGTLFKDGRLAVLLGNGQRLTGTYQAGHLTLAGCSAVLTMATHPGDCQFAYGNTP